MSSAGFVPADFDPPRELVLPAMHLVSLGVEHNESDHAAWTSSIAHIRATPGFESAEWPPIEGMSRARLHASVSTWLADRWPFDRVLYADRAA